MRAQQKNCLLIISKIGFLYTRQKALLCLLSFYCFLSNAQIANYVSNGGFEDTIPNFHQINSNAAKYWNSIDTNKYSYILFSTIPYIGTAPYCGTGFQFPRSGKNFMLGQFFCEGSACSPSTQRGYPRNRLKQKLQFGKTYCAKYYVVNTNNNRIAIEKYGMYFSDNTLDTINYCNLPLTYITPQVENNLGIILDTLNWIGVTGTFVATGNEKYMVLGNFRSNPTTNTLQLNIPLSTQTADIYIDDVSCIPLDLPAYAGPDIWAIPGNTVYVGRPQDVGIDEACTWYNLTNTTTPVANAAGFSLTVSAITATYMVKQDICGVVKYDTVVVHASALGNVEWQMLNDKLKLYPNPAKNNVTLELNALKPQTLKLTITDIMGAVVKEEDVEIKTANEKINLELSTKAGVYFITIKNNAKESITKKLVITD